MFATEAVIAINNHFTTTMIAITASATNNHFTTTMIAITASVANMSITSLLP
jgi:hypothetical protein